ncbi:MAG: hypothetical protein H0X02_06025 [Nitrosomonas sp.]|nr:hypothetical protein [Nitrosomonas sp.]
MKEKKATERLSILSILVYSLFLGLIVGAGVDKSHILPVALIAAVVLYANRNKIAAENIASQSDEVSNPAENYSAWPELGQFAFELTGESCQGAIKQLAQENLIDPREDSGSKVHTLKAHLIPDNDNLYDSSVIRVDIHHRTVGYLNRGQAHSFHRRLDEKGLSSRITTCNAIITGGGEVNGEILDYGVKLDIEPFESHNPKITVGLP